MSQSKLEEYIKVRNPAAHVEIWRIVTLHFYRKETAIMTLSCATDPIGIIIDIIFENHETKSNRSYWKSFKNHETQF